ncbi:hypothetical protein [Streptomyces beihaiensis]|uniref:Integral membrane protein n=1 Tax=Streptomyces beihaiensis TaxID=2984495 RepID=A0ABT3TVL0_9ACTN|nr:hypothetical protein [Streptomyces beihaiensis]MCX3061076.1 hypothetical protein [Streptomyces beihaiensis]
MRGVGAASFLAMFALAGVGTVVLTRLSLAWAGYPKLGGGSHLHIAHMLWGGLLMAAAVLLTVVFLGRAARSGAAVVGGVGFGLFIDEVGKQVTDEPGYFYRPAAGIIYASFVLLALLTHLVRRRARRAPLTPRQCTANAADLALTGVTGGGLSAEQRLDALRLVGGSRDEVDVALTRLLTVLPARPPRRAGRLRRLGVRARRRLGTVARSRWAVGFAVLWVPAEVLAHVGWTSTVLVDGRSFGGGQEGAAAAVMAGTVVAGAFGAAGLVRLVRRTGGPGSPYRLLRYGLLTDVVFTQIFEFTMSQVMALAELAVDLAVLCLLTAALTRRTRQVRPASAPAPAPAPDARRRMPMPMPMPGEPEIRNRTARTASVTG